MLGPAMARRSAPVDVTDEEQPDFYGQLHIKVLRCEKSTDGGHINYVYEAALANQKWMVKRRYSDFEKLQDSLSRRFRKLKKQLPQLPKTAWYRKTDADYVKKKGIKLEAYLNGLLVIPDVANSPELYNFFFKARFAVGMRASFSGMPDSGSFNRSTIGGSPPEGPVSANSSAQASPNIHSLQGLPGEHTANLSPSAFDAQLMADATWESDGAAVMQALPKGSADYVWLTETNLEIAHKSAQLDSLKMARDDMIRSLLCNPSPHTSTPPPRLLGSSSPCVTPEQLGSASVPLTSNAPVVEEKQQPLHQLLSQTQAVDCSFYGTMEAIQQAIQLGVLLVAFPRLGTEVAVQLQQATGGSSLCGQTILNGQQMRFEGQLAGVAGTGCLQLVQFLQDY